MRYVPCCSSLIEFPSTELACRSIINWLTCFKRWIEIWSTSTAFTWFTYRSNSLPKLHTLQLPFRNLLLSTWLGRSFYRLLLFNTASRWLRFVIGYSTSKSLLFQSFSRCVSRFPLLLHVKRFSLLLKYFYAYLWMLLVCLLIKLPFACWTLYQICSTATRWTWVFIRIFWRLLGLITSCQFIMELEFWWHSTTTSFVNWAVHHSRLTRTEWVIIWRRIDIICRLLDPFLSLRSTLMHVLSRWQSLPTLPDTTIWRWLVFFRRERSMIWDIVFRLLLRCLDVIFIRTSSIIYNSPVSLHV